MDPQRGGWLQWTLTRVLSAVMGTAYLVLSLRHRRKAAGFPEPAHLVPPPDVPIDSLRLAFALNPKTPRARLEQLARDPDPFVRRAVARNPGLPRPLLRRLGEDPDPRVADEARQVLSAGPVGTPDSGPLSG